MTPQALSRLTWTADDRRAWNEAYQHARAIERRRRRLREEARRRDPLQARADEMYAEESARYCEHGYPDHGDGCPDCDVPSHLPSVMAPQSFADCGPACDVVGRHSVHVDSIGRGTYEGDDYRG